MLNKTTIQINIIHPVKYLPFYTIYEKNREYSQEDKLDNYNKRLEKLLIVLDAVRTGIYSKEAIELYGKYGLPTAFTVSSLSKAGDQRDGEVILLTGYGDSSIVERWLARHKFICKVFHFTT